MRAIVNGVEGNKLGLFKGANETLKVPLLEDNGLPFDVSGDTDDTIQLLVYATKDRRNAPVKEITVTIGDDVAGYCTVALTPAIMDFGPQVNAVPYYGFFKVTEVGGVEYVALIPIEIHIK
jgi:hypothetical protein